MASVPRSLITISDCLMDELPRPEYWDWFQVRADAERAQEDVPTSVVVSVALEPQDASELIDHMGGPEQPWFVLLRRKVAAAGRLLGYEIVGAEQTLDFHSWHCHGYADELLAARGIRVNDVGLFATMTDARDALQWMLALPADEAPAPVPWFVVAILA